jgi:hypothetical protein
MREAEGQLVFGMTDQQASDHVRESFYDVAIRLMDAGPYPREARELDAMSYAIPPSQIGRGCLSTTEIALLGEADESKIWMLDARRPRCPCGAPGYLRALYERRPLGPVKLTYELPQVDFLDAHHVVFLGPPGASKTQPVHRPWGPARRGDRVALAGA